MLGLEPRILPEGIINSNHYTSESFVDKRGFNFFFITFGGKTTHRRVSILGAIGASGEGGSHHNCSGNPLARNF